MSNIQNLKIYDIIEQFEDLVENSPKPKLGGNANKRIVDVEEIFDLLGDLKATIPEDIRRANSVIAESRTMLDNAEEHARDVAQDAENQAAAIVASANDKSAHILEKAKLEYERLISEDEIYQEAQKRAQLLAMKAEYNAGEVYENAKTYADDILSDLDRFLGEYKRLVEVNRRDLDARAPRPIAPAQAAPAVQIVPAPAAAPQERAPKAARKPVEEEYDDEDAFDDEEDERGGFLFGLFKKKKNFDEEDFDDAGYDE
ncbi:MAG: hypothetical protein LBN26_07030 [Christensenellaceae bacterium]|jgi:cell division septum initiation protein DivIVA|nr:hypothetical protein [Christensenellaceae bacterium]